MRRRLLCLSAVVSLISSADRLAAFNAESKTVTVNSGSAASSPLATRLYLDAGTTAAPVGTTVWFVADRDGNGVPTAPGAGAILGADDEIIFRDIIDGDQPGSTAGRYRRLDIPVNDALRTAVIYLYVWNGQGAEFTPVNGSTFGLYRFGVVPPPEVGNAPWLIATNVNASEFRVGGGGPANQPPVIAALPEQQATNGVSLAFTVGATDPDAGQTVSFSLEPGSPAGAEIVPATGAFSWTPTASQIGTNVVTVRATDNGTPAQSATRAITIVVHPARVEPPAPALTTTFSSGTLRIALSTVAGASYRLQSRTNLVSGSWIDSGTPVAGTGSSVTFEAATGAEPRQFFRVVAE